MRIPVPYYESMVRRYKKQRIQDTQDFSWVDLEKPILELLASYANLQQLQNPQFIKIVMDNIDRVLESAVILFKDGLEEAAIACFGHATPDLVWDACLKCCDIILKFNPRQVDMFFSYEHLFALLYYNPTYQLKQLYLVVTALQFLITHFNSSKSSKFRSEQFEKTLLRFVYLNTFLQKTIFNLNESSQCELFDYHLHISDPVLTITLPSDEMMSYSTSFDSSQIRKILAHPPKKHKITLRQQHPLQQAEQIAQQLNIQNESLLFDQIYVRSLIFNNQDERILHQFFLQNYTFQLQIQFSDTNLTNGKNLNDVANRQIDQKDYLVIMLRAIGGDLDSLIVKSLIQIKSKQQQIFEQGVYNEKLLLFELSIIHETINNLVDRKPLKYNQELVQVVFMSLRDPQYSQQLKKQNLSLQWNRKILQLADDTLDAEGKLQISQYIIQPLLHFLINQIAEANTSSQMDYNLEQQIIGKILLLIRKTTDLAFKVELFYALDRLTAHYKAEYDQIQMQNAQSEHMVPVPERFHKLLSNIWDQKILEETLQKFPPHERLYQYLLSILSFALGENPARVRQFLESNGLSLLISKIISLLQICSRGSPLIVIFINLLISISTNEDAIQLALQNTENQENLIKKIFNKCYLPSQDLINDPSVGDDFAKKIIMFYSQSQLAKKQIERVIESTFVTISQMVDLSKEKIEDIIENKERLKSFYALSKCLQALLQLFSQLKPDRRTYRGYQAYEDIAQEEAQRQKDYLFKSLIKNAKFAEALEKIIMSPILIGSKNKDKYVEDYVNELQKQNKLNPFVALWKELELIQSNYMIIDGQKVIDISKLVDYNALSVHMSERYFFRKIIKHISPETYRGFYIMSRFHLIHYLIKKCKDHQNNPHELATLIEQLLEIFYLSSQHAGFHESIIMTMSAKQHLSKQLGAFEDSQLSRRISRDNLIPLQQSCLELAAALQNQATSEQKERIIKKYGEIIVLFLANIQERIPQIQNGQGTGVLEAVTYIQDMLKSVKHLLKQFASIEGQYHHLQFLSLIKQNSHILRGIIDLMCVTEEKIKALSIGREFDIVKKVLVGFQDAFQMHVDQIIKELFFKKVILDKVTLENTVISDPAQLDLVANELQISMARNLLKLADVVLQSSCENQLRTILQSIVAKFQGVKELGTPEMRKLLGNEAKEAVGSKEIASIFSSGSELIKKKQSIFERQEVKQVLDMVVQEMGFPERLAKKAIKRVEIPEPTLIIDMLINGRVSDDEEEAEEWPQEDKIEKMDQLIQQMVLQKQELKEQQEQMQKLAEPLEEGKLNELLDRAFPERKKGVAFQEQCQGIFEEFHRRLDELMGAMIDQQLKCGRQNSTLLDYLFTLVKKPHHTERLIEAVFNVFQSTSSFDTQIDQMINGLSWLQLIKSVNSPHHEQIYSNQFEYEDQKDQKASKLKLSLLELIRIGQRLNLMIKTHLSALLEQEAKQISELTIGDNYQEIHNQVQSILSKSNLALEKKSHCLKLFCQELQEAYKCLTKQVQAQNQAKEDSMEEYWKWIRVYANFLIDILRSDFKLQELNQQCAKKADEFENMVLSNSELKQQKEAGQIQGYFRTLIMKKSFGEKQIVQTLMILLNNFGLFNQRELKMLLFGVPKDSTDEKDLLNLLLSMKINNIADLEENHPYYLENILYLIFFDQQASSEAFKIYVRQAILNEHCDWYAQQLKGAQNLKEIQLPAKYIEASLSTILSTYPALVNNPLFYQMIVDQDTPLSVANKYQELSRTHPPKPPSKSAKEQANTAPPSEIVIRWDLEHKQNSEPPQINEQFSNVVQLLCQLLIDRFIEENGKLLEWIFGVQVQGQSDSYRSYFFSWDLIMRILETMLQKVPYLSLFMRTVQVKVPAYLEGLVPTNFIALCVKFLTWATGDKFPSFLHNYLADICLVNYAYGLSIASETLKYVIAELYIQVGENQPQKYYHQMQVLQLLIQMLTLQTCSLVLCDSQSPLNLIPHIVQIIEQQKGNEQVSKLYIQTLSKVIEPLLSAQTFYDVLKEPRYLELLRIEMRSKDVVQVHYLHSLRYSLFLHTSLQNHKGQINSAQYIILQNYCWAILKEDQSVEVQWPPYLSRRSLFQNKHVNPRQADEDLSDSDSDQEIIQNQDNNGLQARGKAHYSYDYQMDNEYFPKYSGGREEERYRPEQAQNIWASISTIQINFFAPEDLYPLDYNLPQLSKISQQSLYYNEQNQKSWIYQIASIYFLNNDYFETKKLQLHKTYEQLLKGTVDQLGTLCRYLSSSQSFRSIRFPEAYWHYYLNGCLQSPTVIPSTLSYMNKFGQHLNQNQADYHANQLTVPQNDPLHSQLRILSHITCALQSNRILLNNMPLDLIDQTIIKAQIQSIMPNEECNPIKSKQVAILFKLLVIDHKKCEAFDEMILFSIRLLLFDNFLFFPHNLIKQTSKCPRLGTKMLVLLLQLLYENKSNLDHSLRILNTISSKVSSNNLKTLLVNAVEISPILNRREKANLDKLQVECFNELEELVEEYSAQQKGGSPLILMIQLITTYSEKNYVYLRSIDPENFVPLDKNILVTPLLNQQTSLHLNYLINILQGALVQGEELKKQRIDEELLNVANQYQKLDHLGKRMSTLYQNRDLGDENQKFFELLAKGEDNHFEFLRSSKWPSEHYGFLQEGGRLSDNLQLPGNLAAPQTSQTVQTRLQDILKVVDKQVSPLQQDLVENDLQALNQNELYKANIGQEFELFKEVLCQQQFLGQPINQQQQPGQLSLQQHYQQEVKYYLHQQQQQAQAQEPPPQIQMMPKHQMIRLFQPALVPTQLPDLSDPADESQSILPKKRKVSEKIAHMELELIAQLCSTLESPLLRDNYAEQIIQILINYAKDKYKVEHAIRKLSIVIQNSAKSINIELERKRKALRELKQQHTEGLKQDKKSILFSEQVDVIRELNNKTPEPVVIQRAFLAMSGFLNISNKEEAAVKAKPTSQQTRNQIKKDREQFTKSQAAQKPQPSPQESSDSLSRKEIRKLYLNVLQTQQTHHLWLNVVETLLLVFDYEQVRSLDLLQRKLQPLLECFLKLYQNVQEDQTAIQLGYGAAQVDHSFFEKTQSGSSSYTLQFGVSQMQQGHLQRSFSAIREQNEMQLKIDELFTYLCVNGKSIINSLIHGKLISINLEPKNLATNIKNFKENDPLGFVFFKMSQIISFDNKKLFFEAELDQFRANDRSGARTKSARPNDQLEFSMQREQRLQHALDKVLAHDKVKFRKSDLKIKYIGERGQDEGGIRKEWMTNLIRDILETDKFELNSKRFYKIKPMKKLAEDLSYYRLLGRILAKAINDNQLVPAYLIPPIFKQILLKKLNFDDLEHFDEGYYETFLKMMNEETLVTYKELFEFWIPEDYATLIEMKKMNIFPEMIQEYFDKIAPPPPIQSEEQDKLEQKEQQEKSQQNDEPLLGQRLQALQSQVQTQPQPQSQPQQQQQPIHQPQPEDQLPPQPQQQNEQQQQEKEIIQPLLQAQEDDFQQQQKQLALIEQPEQVKSPKKKDQIPENMPQLVGQALDADQPKEGEQKQEKKQNEDILIKDRQKKREQRQKKRQTPTEEQLKGFKLQNYFSTLDTKVSQKHKRLICEAISKQIMNDEIQAQINCLREGFFDILPKEFFSYMDWRDLQKLIIGVPYVDIDDLQANTEYSNYEPNNQTVIWFWEVLRGFSDSDKADFLMFSTGSPLVPFGGFKNLRGQNGPKKFTICRDYNAEHLIKSHTCFNRIDLPECTSKELLREKLIKSIRESEGFDLS